MTDVNEAMEALSAASDMVSYIKFGPSVLDELDLIRSTLKEALDRLSKNIQPAELPEFQLAIQQIRIMATDLLGVCKKKITISA